MGVLDVGCFDGFYMFLAARGAVRVVAVDNQRYRLWVASRRGAELSEHLYGRGPLSAGPKRGGQLAAGAERARHGRRRAHRGYCSSIVCRGGASRRRTERRPGAKAASGRADDVAGRATASMNHDPAAQQTG